jgi:hypothetical protein
MSQGTPKYNNNITKNLKNFNIHEDCILFPLSGSLITFSLKKKKKGRKPGIVL